MNTPTPQPSSLPPSSPPPPFTSDDESDNGVVDELEQIQDIDLGGSHPDEAGEEEEGEDLFGDDMMELGPFISLSLSPTHTHTSILFRLSLSCFLLRM